MTASSCPCVLMTRCDPKNGGPKTGHIFLDRLIKDLCMLMKSSVGDLLVLVLNGGLIIRLFSKAGYLFILPRVFRWARLLLNSNEDGFIASKSPNNERKGGLGLFISLASLRFVSKVGLPIAPGFVPDFNPHLLCDI
uniref:Uncharacterized protein n=1 Tax=Romanomermis culicivorax TaxID=13658 RepID=A0A915KS11_ROMCU